MFRNQFDAEYGVGARRGGDGRHQVGQQQPERNGSIFGRDKALNERNFSPPARSRPSARSALAARSADRSSRTGRTFFAAFEHNDLDTVNIVALPPTNPFAIPINGEFPSGTRNHLGDAKVDHRLSDQNSLFVRWAHDNQNDAADRQRQLRLTSAERLQPLAQHHRREQRGPLAEPGQQPPVPVHEPQLGTVPNNFDLNIAGRRPTSARTRPCRSTSRASAISSSTPSTSTRRATTSSSAATSTFAHHEYDAHFFQAGFFQFTTDLPFNANNPRTWPISFTQQTPGLWTYNSHSVDAFAEDDWRVADRVRLNLGLRYHFDTDLRLIDYFNGLLAEPALSEPEQVRVRPTAATTTRTSSRASAPPRTCAATARSSPRGGVGRYSTRNRQYFQMTTQDRTLGTAVLIQDPNQMRFYPDIDAVLGGKSLTDYVATGGARSLFLIEDDYVLPYSWNTTPAFGWQLNSVTSLDVDYVHDVGLKQLGAYDAEPAGIGRDQRDQPAACTAVQRSEGDAELHRQLVRRARDAAPHARPRRRQPAGVRTRSRYSMRDGVNHYQNYPGTMRTPSQYGYRRAATGTTSRCPRSTTLPWTLQFSGIVRWPERPAVHGAGRRRSRRRRPDAERSPGHLPITVGMGDVNAQLAVINAFRASRNLAPVNAALLDLDQYLSLDLRLTKQIGLGSTRHSICSSRRTTSRTT